MGLAYKIALGVLGASIGIFGCKTQLDKERGAKAQDSQHIQQISGPSLYSGTFEIADFNNDGKDDVLLATASMRRVDLHFINDYTSPNSFPTYMTSIPGNCGLKYCSITTKFHVADLDNDGDLDFIVGAPNDEEYNLFRFNNDGKGNFSQ